MRTIPAELAKRYEAEGWWTQDTFGDLLARRLAAAPQATFRVHSAVRPWAGTFRDVELVARRLAAGLRDRGVGPGDVVAFQLPNWMEAAAVFWASAFLGAVVVPIVHFYGRKEVGYVLRTIAPRVFVTAERFGRLEYQPDLCAGVPIVAVVGQGRSGESLPWATSFDDLLGAEPMPGNIPTDPAGPALIAFTSGTTRDPKGVIHSHQTLGFETRQLAERYPPDRGLQLTAAPVGHFIGMVNAFLIPVLDASPVHLTDVWDPARVLALMASDGLTVGGGAPYYLTSLLDHPDFAPEHLRQMKYAGLGGRRFRPPSPPGWPASASRYGAPTAAPSIPPSPAAIGRARGQAAVHRRERPARRGDPAGRQRGDLQPGAGSVPGLHRSGPDHAGLRRGGLVPHGRHRRTRRGRLPHDHRPDG